MTKFIGATAVIRAAVVRLSAVVRTAAAVTSEWLAGNWPNQGGPHKNTPSHHVKLLGNMATLNPTNCH